MGLSLEPPSFRKRNESVENMTKLMCFFNVLKIIFAIVSAVFFGLAAKSEFPEAPHPGGVLEAKPFEKLFEQLKISANYNKYGCLFLTFSIVCEILLFFLGLYNNG